MIERPCKICQAAMFCPSDLWSARMCGSCHQYMILLTSKDNFIEYLLFGDWDLSFWQQDQIAKLKHRANRNTGWTIVKEFKIQELTIALAQEWLIKLKGYQLLS